jgi:hypothetical protein
MRQLSSQNKKITVVCPPDPTPNKGDASSLTIVAYEMAHSVRESHKGPLITGENPLFEK